MASGTLAQSSPAAATNTTVYTVPAGTVGSISICACNRTYTEVRVNIAIAALATPTDAEYIEFNTSIPPYGVLERTGLVVSSNKRIVVFVSTADVSINIYGYEE
jgi:hypothetical protein